MVSTSECSTCELRLGLQHRKAGYLHLLSRQLVTNHQGDIPDSVAGLTSLPGVGSKIAHLGSHTALHYSSERTILALSVRCSAMKLVCAVMNAAWGVRSGISVDTHVHRSPPC